MSSNIYDPSVAASKSFPMAKRLESLAGKVVGLYDNTKERADIILEVLGAELQKQHGVKSLISRRGVHFSHPVSTEILEEMVRECDVVICALGA